MELYFKCPRRHVGFLSEAWTVDSGLRVHVEKDGTKRLQGTVRVVCPVCRAEHAFRPDELACPLTSAKSEQPCSPNPKGGTECREG